MILATGIALGAFAVILFEVVIAAACLSGARKHIERTLWR